MMKFWPSNLPLGVEEVLVPPWAGGKRKAGGRRRARRRYFGGPSASGHSFVRPCSCPSQPSQGRSDDEDVNAASQPLMTLSLSEFKVKKCTGEHENVASVQSSLQPCKLTPLIF